MTHCSASLYRSFLAWLLCLNSMSPFCLFSSSMVTRAVPDSWNETVMGSRTDSPWSLIVFRIVAWN